MPRPRSYTYLLGDSPTEAQRLRAQARLWDPTAHALFDRLKIRRGMRVLEIGPGAGSLHRELRRRVRAPVDAVEPSDPFARGIERLAARDGFGQGQIWRANLSTDRRIFYVNNDPIAAPANHPVLRTALSRATGRLLGNNPHQAIQETTGPGNLTAALAAHANGLIAAGAPLDFTLLRNWETVAETRWRLSYRDDQRNWRNMDAG